MHMITREVRERLGFAIDVDWLNEKIMQITHGHIQVGSVSDGTDHAKRITVERVQLIPDRFERTSISKIGIKRANLDHAGPSVGERK